MTGPGQERPRSRGSVSVEAMILVPVFLVVVFTILEGSLWVYSSSVAQAAAQDGARAGTVLGGDAQEGRDVARDILQACSAGEGWEVVTMVTGQTLTVTVTGYAPSVIPGLGFRVRESATLPLEGQ